MSFTSGAAWQWPDDVPKSPDPVKTERNSHIPGAFHEEPIYEQPSRPRQRKPPTENHPQNPKPAKSWPPRTCRICLETVLPTFRPSSTSLPDVLQSAPSVTYESDDPTAGRLIRPCKCKGSSRYVHEGCLQAWRHADPDYGKRNYWQCPTCGFRYRLERMRWGRAISSTATQFTLTISILFLAMFILGFVADPIINFYVDPYSTLSSGAFSNFSTKTEPLSTYDEVPTWTEHFIKGLASLGLLSFVKVLFALSPWQWWNLRNSGIMGGGSRTGGNGRDRLASISWLLVIIGVGTFLWGVYKGVRAWSRRTLEKASERVMDVPLADDDDEFDEADRSSAD